MCVDMFTKLSMTKTLHSQSNLFGVNHSSPRPRVGLHRGRLGKHEPHYLCPHRVVSQFYGAPFVEAYVQTYVIDRQSGAAVFRNRIGFSEDLNT